MFFFIFVYNIYKNFYKSILKSIVDKAFSWKPTECHGQHLILSYSY